MMITYVYFGAYRSWSPAPWMVWSPHIHVALALAELEIVVLLLMEELLRRLTW